MSKKTETLEVRVSPELKARFTAVSRERGQPMSHIIRHLMQQEIDSYAPDPHQHGVRAMNSWKLHRFGTIAASGLVVLGLALAMNAATQSTVSARADVRVTFAEMDVNDDGKITQQEYETFWKQMEEDFEQEEDIAHADDTPAACKADFAKLEELDRHHGHDQYRYDFSAVDGNKDGAVRYAELQSAFDVMHTAEFREIDRNQDAFLDTGELMRAFQEDEPSLSKACKDAMLESHPDAFEFHEDDARLILAQFDENRDRKISLQEFIENQPADIGFGD